MKLFIVNKDVFDADFPHSQREIHKKAYNSLMKNLGLKMEIPKKIGFEFDCWFVEFIFTNKVDDTYFYNYERW